MPLNEFRVLDRRFHTLVANACANPLLVEMYGKVLDALFRSAEFESLLYHEANRDRSSNSSSPARSTSTTRSPRRSSTAHRSTSWARPNPTWPASSSAWSRI